MTIKGFTEYRGTANRVAFDHSTGQFFQSQMPHPFLASLGSTAEAKDKAVVQKRRRISKTKNAAKSIKQRPVAVSHAAQF